jgi:hypothetical protein
MKCSITRRDERLFLRFPYNETVIARIKSMPGRRWHPDMKQWSLPAARDTLSMACDLCGVLPEMLSSDFVDLVDVMEFTPLPIDLALLDGHQWIVEPYQHP